MRKQRGKMAVQKLVGAALVIAAICGGISHLNIAVVICAAALGLVFLFARKIIFEI